jgi:tRNA threonylcarbamoyladenosine biosynthesis protein TsaE
MAKLTTAPLSLGELELFAQKLASHLLPPLSISLIGTLGVGKTTFVKALVAALGIHDNVSSPSFVLQNEYRGDSIIVEHWDLYRIQGETEELLEPPSDKVLRLVEWGNFANSSLFDVSLIFKMNGDSHRVLEIETASASALDLNRFS